MKGTEGSMKTMPIKRSEKGENRSKNVFCSFIVKKQTNLKTSHENYPTVFGPVGLSQDSHTLSANAVSIQLLLFLQFETLLPQLPWSAPENRALPFNCAV